MIYRGVVMAAEGERFLVTVPGLAGDSELGPMPAGVPDVAVGLTVYVATVQGRNTDLVIVGREL